MRPITYHILWPGGNTTAIVEQEVPRALQPSAARDIMAQDAQIEQVGFIEQPTIPAAAFRLQMMGGEFCANAARAAAYWWLQGKKQTSVDFEISGFPQIIHFNLDGMPTLTLDGRFFIKSTMNKGETIVDLQGIRHIVTTTPGDKDEALKLIKKYSQDSPATGAIFVSANGKENQTIDAYVQVAATQTCFHETACGSGSMAAALVAYQKTGRLHHIVKQASGSQYQISFTVSRGHIQKINLAGDIEYRGISKMPTR